MRFAEVIAQDHDAVRRGLNILDRMVQRIEEGQLIEIFDIRTVIKFLSAFGERYPEADVQELVGSIESSLSPKHGVGFVHSSRRLIHLLQNQINKEQVEDMGSETPASPPVAPIMTETYAAFARLERKYASTSRVAPIEMDRRAHA